MEEFDTPGPLHAVIELGMGDILVRATKRSTTTVEVVPARPGRRADEEAAAGTTVQCANGRLEVRSPRQGVLGLIGRTAAVTVAVELPSGSDLAATTAFGDIVATGTLARARARTRAGDVRVEDGASVELQSSAGDVEVGRVGEDGILTTSAGSVRVDAVAGSVRVKCTTGEVALGRVAGAAEVICPYGRIRVREAASGSLDLTSTYADIEVGIPQGTAALLDVSTNHGRIRNELSRTPSPPEASERLEVTARTNYGTVTIRRS